MKTAVVYIHGKGGSAGEAEHYKALLPDCDVIGFDYKAETPREAQREFPVFIEKVKKDHASVTLVANSIGAFFAINSLAVSEIERAYFISPIVNMEKLIADMLLWSGENEATLKEKRIIETAFGETLSWEYLSWIRDNPVSWSVPTEVIYGSTDTLQSPETIKSFCTAVGAGLTVMENGEHWFHTAEQMEFLDNWIAQKHRENIMGINTVINNMLDWAKNLEGKPMYAGWCLSFIEDALEKSNDIEIFGGDSAKESSEMYSDALQTGTPECGAFVFYDCLCRDEDGSLVNWGHCGICIGEGKVIHAWDVIRVDSYTEIENLIALTGDKPKYIGWVPVERVLAQKP